jgi:hypothetical protein
MELRNREQRHATSQTLRQSNPGTTPPIGTMKDAKAVATPGALSGAETRAPCYGRRSNSSSRTDSWAADSVRPPKRSSL